MSTVPELPADESIGDGQSRTLRVEVTHVTGEDAHERRVAAAVALLRRLAERRARQTAEAER